MQAFIQKHRKKLLILPVFLFIGISIFLLVKHQLKPVISESTNDSLQTSRFNDQFPAPNVRDKEKNKFEIYMQAQRDSLERSQSTGSLDPRLFNTNNTPDTSSPATQGADKGYHASSKDIEHQERRVNEQLDKIMSEINKKEPAIPVRPEQDLTTVDAKNREAEIARLEQMIADLQLSGTGNDEEMNRLNNLLEKLVDLENPKPKQPENKRDSTKYNHVNLAPIQSNQPAGFHSLLPDPLQATKQKRAIKALILGGQTLVNGSTIKLRLQEKIYIDQVEIPSFTAIDGLCRISDERLLITIDRIIHNAVIYPIQLSVYDTRGMQGIHAPGAITRDAAKEQLAQTMQSVGSYNIPTSVTSEIATSAIQGASGLLSRKARLVRVLVNTDFSVFLQ